MTRVSQPDRGPGAYDSTVGSARLAASSTVGPSIALAPFDAVRRTGVVGRVLATIVATSVGIASLGVQRGTAAGAAPLLGEERLQW